MRLQDVDIPQAVPAAIRLSQVEDPLPNFERILVRESSPLFFCVRASTFASANVVTNVLGGKSDGNRPICELSESLDGAARYQRLGAGSAARGRRQLPQ